MKFIVWLTADKEDNHNVHQLKYGHDNVALHKEGGRKGEREREGERAQNQTNCRKDFINFPHSYADIMSVCTVVDLL